MNGISPGYCKIIILCSLLLLVTSSLHSSPPSPTTGYLRELSGPDASTAIKDVIYFMNPSHSNKSGVVDEAHFIRVGKNKWLGRIKRYGNFSKVRWGEIELYTGKVYAEFKHNHPTPVEHIDLKSSTAKVTASRPQDIGGPNGVIIGTIHFFNEKSKYDSKVPFLKPFTISRLYATFSNNMEVKSWTPKDDRVPLQELIDAAKNFKD